MDGHQHAHVAKVVFPIFLKTLSKFKINFTRIPIEPGLDDSDWLPEGRKKFYQMLTNQAQQGIDGHNLTDFNIYSESCKNLVPEKDF